MGQQVPKYEHESSEEASLLRSIAVKEEKMKALERKQAQAEKRRKQIEASNTWKFGNLLEPFKKVWNRIFRPSQEEKKEISHLEETIRKQQERIDELEERLLPLVFLDEQLTPQVLRQKIRRLKEEGKLLESFDAILEQKHRLTDQYREALIYTARLYMQEDPAIRARVYEDVFSGLTSEEIPEFMVRASLEEAPVSLGQASSFRASLTKRIRQSQLVGPLPDWALDDKRTAYDFVQAFGIRVPQIDEETYTLDSLSPREATVIKPADAGGARGVYLVHDEENIYDVHKTKTLTSFEALKEAMQEDLRSGAVAEDQWLVEELIYENKADLLPARDIKFYSFYGKVGLILEIVRDPEIRHAWWTVDGRRITTGKYDASLFAGQGVTEEEIAQVEALSKAIPTPFMRIDFLRSEEGLVFGEFTPKPGNYDEFDRKTDQLLGDYFIEAEARLWLDLLNGKTFPEFTSFLATHKREQKIYYD